MDITINCIKEIIVQHLNIHTILNFVGFCTTMYSAYAAGIAIPKYKKEIERQQELVEFIYKKDDIIKELEDLQNKIQNLYYNHCQDFKIKINAALTKITSKFPSLINKEIKKEINNYKKLLDKYINCNHATPEQKIDLSNKLIEIISKIEKVTQYETYK